VCLSLVATGGTTATGLFELATLGADVWSGVTSGTTGTTTVTGPVTNTLTSETRSTEEDTVGASWEKSSELVESDDLTTVGEDASTSRLGHTKSTELDALRSLEHADVVSDGTDDDSHLALLATHELSELGEGKWWAVHAGHEKPLEDNRVELGLGAASKEAV